MPPGSAKQASQSSSIQNKQNSAKVEESRSSESSPYAGLLRLTLDTDAGEVSVAGTLFEPDRARLVEVDGVAIESNPNGHLLFLRNRDVPGVVGRLGTILGRADINIAGIHLGRTKSRGDAVSIIRLDSKVPDKILAEIRGLDDIVNVRCATV